MPAYLRQIGNRLCATFENGQFYMSEDEDGEEEILRDAGVTRDQLPADVQLPSIYYEIAYICCGA